MSLENQIDNIDYEDQINDLYPIEVYVNKQTKQKDLWKITLRENQKLNNVLGKINHDRLVRIKKRRSKNNV